MPPDLISTYTKDLNIIPLGDKKLLEEFHFFTRDGGLFKCKEFIVSGGNYHYYLEVYLLGCSTIDYYSDYGCQLDDEGYNQEEIVSELISLGMEEPKDDLHIARIVYNDFTFIDEGRHCTGKQIKIASIDGDYQSAGLGREIYKILTMKHEFLICDNIQSIAGGALWAKSIHSIAEVRIYDSISKKFIDILGSGGRGIAGCVPWSASNLNIDDIVKWGREYCHHSCHHIVHVISKRTLY